ncbi:protein SENSITIVE TO UV 2 isoform X3 [Elaeis guineensis]|uniref:protein SENSITIVE TO UV 2 isoform X3 n=1 Tax=Elaeis guineensis var. tenera TaxID=51953 RepID=UPI003C6CCB7A
MSFEGIDEWDENFLDEAIRIELEAISSRNPPSDPTSSSRDHNGAGASSRPEPEPEPIPPRNPALVRSEQDYFPPIPSSDAGWGAQNGGFSFSPPRELSQRFPERPNLEDDCEIIDPLVLNNAEYGDRSRRGGGGAKKDKEVERLKRELGRVSKQLNHLEHECMELKKDKAWKDEQLKYAFSQIEAKDAEICGLNRKNLGVSKLDLHNNGSFVDQAGCSHINEDKGTRSITQALRRTTDCDYGRSKGANEPSAAVSELKHHILIDNSKGLTTSSGGAIQEGYFPEKPARSKCNKTVGIQTDFVQNYSHITPKDLAEEHISSKLLAIWVPPNKNTGRNLISKLLVSCSADFCVLFQCLSMTSKMDLDCPSDRRFADRELDDLSQPILLTDAAKVSHLYAILMKMHKEVGQLHTFLEALLDLCTLENVVLVHRSLRILHAILQLLLSCDISSNQRNNVLIDRSLKNEVCEVKSVEFVNQIVEFRNSEEQCNKVEASSLFSTDKRSFDLENLCKEKLGSNDTFLPSESWISIFGAMKQIALRIRKECVQSEALSIMILILMRSNSNAERKRFGLLSFLEVVPQLLQKEVGLHVQKQTVRLLFLLLNCPEMLMMFCSGGKVGMEQEETVDGHIDALQRAINSVLEGLSECLASGGTGTLELKLRKQIIILLAHIASYGQSGFEVLLNPVRPQGLNFLGLIVRVLASEMDVEITDLAKTHALCKERTSLMREALILLNRLASHPTYSRAAIDALMSSNSTASLTIDVANRIPQKSRGCCKHDGTKTTQMEAEIMDLARLFRSRVFAFL